MESSLMFQIATTGTRITTLSETGPKPFSTPQASNDTEMVLLPLWWLQTLERLEQVLDPSWKWKRIPDGDV